MNRNLLIAVIIGISIYIFWSGDESSDISSASQEVNENISRTTTPEYSNAPEEVILQSLDSIFGDYGLKITSKKGKTTTGQFLSIKENNTFELRRYTIETVDDQVDVTASGDFSYDQNKLTLNFSGQRDIKIFPEVKIEMTLTNNGDIKYGSFYFIKE